MKNLATLGEHITVLSGFAFDSTNFNAIDGMPIVRIRDVVPGVSKTCFRGEYDDKYLVSDGDLLVGMDGNFNRATWNGGGALLNQRVCKLIVNPKSLHDRYLYHFLPEALQKIEDNTPFATVKHLSAKSIREISIPLPPLPEQRRIASILDQADNLRAKSRHALGMLQDLASSQFSKIIDQSRVSDWESVPLGSISEQQGGLQVSKSRDSLQARAPYLRVANVYRGMLSLKEIKSIGVTQTELVRTQLRFGDLLIVEGHGNAGEIGRVAMWNADVRQMVHQNHLIRVRVFPLRLNAKYAEAFLNSAQSIAYWQRVAKTTSGLNTINMANVRAAPILVPPLSIQNDFVARIQDIRTVATAQEKHLASADELFASLQYRAFRGEL